MSLERRIRGENVVPLLEWTVDDVLSWLKSLRLSQDYSPLFREYHVDGLFLSKITPNFIDTNLSIITTSDRSILIQSISNLRIHQLTTALPRLPINEHSIPTPPLSGNDTTVATPTGGPRGGGATTGGGHSKSKSFDDLINDYQAPPNAPPTTNSIHNSSSHHVLKSLTPVPHSQVVSTHLLDIMKEENADLKKELDYYYKRVCRLQKFEQELESLQEAHRSMVASTARKEKLELVMRQKLEEELKQYRESNAQYEVQIATVKRNASLKNTKPDNVMRKEIARKDSIIARLIKQNQDGVLMRERLEKDLHHMRHTAVPAAPTSDEEEEEENERVTNDSKITDENDKLVSNYSKSIETLRSLFNGMTSSYNKQMTIESKLRKQLETKIHEIEEEKGGERGGGGAEDLNLLNAKLEADKAKLEHKVIELMAERQLLEDSISIPKDAMIRRLERQLQEKENEIKILKEQKSTYTKQLETNEETIEEYKTKVSLLVSTLSDKDMLVNTLKSLLEPDEAPTHQSLSYPRKTSLDTLNERGGGTGPGDIAPVGPIRKTSSPVYPTTTHESLSYKQQLQEEEPSLPTYDEHMLGVIGPVVLYNQPPTNQPTLPHSLPHSVHATPNGLSMNNHLLPNSLSVPGGGGVIKRGVTGGGSRSFPNTPEIHRRVKEGGASVGGGVASRDRFYNKSFVISAPSSHQNSPLLHHKPRPFTKSLTPPPHQLPYMSSQVGVAGRHMIKVHDDVSDNSSIDSLLSPSSPVNNKQWTNKKNKSLINYINREAGHSQDSGVLVELCGHI